MAQPPGKALAGRLRTLRESVKTGRVTQQQLALVLGVSVPSVSAWEAGVTVPPQDRLRAYALAFCSDRTFAGPAPHLPDEGELDEAEDRRRQRLIDELVNLRNATVQPESEPTPDTGELGGRFWYFSDGAPVRIITTPMWQSTLDQIPYADPYNPNYIESYRDADRDATIELFGHVRAENPTADVRFVTADKATRDDLLGHVIVLGGGDQMLTRGRDTSDPDYLATALSWLAPRLELPVEFQLGGGGDWDEDGELAVTLDERGRPEWFPSGVQPAKREVYRPRFLRDVRGEGGPDARPPRLRINGYPVLEYDVALLARLRNPLNQSTTVTICCGIFSRGTFGAVRALTDANLRARNERWLGRQFGSLDDFWLLFYVPVFRGPTGLDTVTPDLSRPFHLLRCHPDPGADAERASEESSG